MINSQQLKTQIDELTKQNELVLMELDYMKKMMGGEQKNQQNQQNSSGNQQDSSQQSDQSQNASCSNMQQQSSKGVQQKSQDQQKQVAQMANDLLKIKDLVEKLERKTSNYVSNQSIGSLTEKDVVSLILTIMNGMVDWASEFVLANKPESGKTQ